MSNYINKMLTVKEINTIVDVIVDDIVSAREGEFYDEVEDPYEATNIYFKDFLGDIRYLVNKKMEENHVDENYNIKK